MVYILSREPIKTLYNYPPKIQERVKMLEEYKDKILTNKNKMFAKIIAWILIIIIISLVLRHVNWYTTFIEGYDFLLCAWRVRHALKPRDMHVWAEEAIALSSKLLLR